MNLFDRVFAWVHITAAATFAALLVFAAVLLLASLTVFGLIIGASFIAVAARVMADERRFSGGAQ